MKLSQKIQAEDDEPDILRLTQFLLESWGYEVVTASSGNEAVEQAQVIEPDLILMDVIAERAAELEKYSKKSHGSNFLSERRGLRGSHRHGHDESRVGQCKIATRRRSTTSRRTTSSMVAHRQTNSTKRPCSTAAMQPDSSTCT